MSRPLSSLTRRELLRRAGALGLTGPGAALGLNLAAMGQASAAGAGDYKALVCIFLTGGNDALNTVLTTDATNWGHYGAARGTTALGIALAAPGTPAAASGSLNARLGGALPITPATTSDGRPVALHPCLGAVRDLFEGGRLAVLGNVGPLVGPTTKAAYQARQVAVPAKLFSHNDQQAMWQSFAPEGGTRGWGGQFADALLSQNRNAMFSALSLSGNAVWLAGQTAQPYQMAPEGAVRIGGSTGLVYGSAAVQQKMQALMRSARNNSVLERDHARMVGRSIDAETLLSGALPGVTAGPWGSNASAAADPLLQFRNPTNNTLQYNPLSHQLQGVARSIAARTSLGMNRQVFFVSLGGFDTHDDQVNRQAVLLAQLNQALKYFDTTLQSMGVDDSVTTFTASDFGRTLACNGDGTDHGWGGHHFILGGAVRGGELYGRLPVLGPNIGGSAFDSPDLLNSGLLLPSTSVDQYAATLGRWLGLGDSTLLGLLPGLRNWSTAQRNLGFMA
jgi:uncharacterized protein (DUF1501 family)